MSDVIGFIGLGQIGGPMAEHLVDRPGGLVVCDIRPEVTTSFAEKGARVAADPAALAKSADVISVMVRDDDQVREVVGGILTTARAGTIVALHSTIRVGTAEHLAELAARTRVTVVDAPVAGGFIGAAGASLAVMIGGSEEAVERCREPFGRWASLIVHVGPVGAGTRAKLARNLLQFAAYSAAAEAQRLADAADIDLVQLGNVVRHSDRVTGGPGAIMLRSTTAPLAEDDPLFAILSHTRDLGEKDLALALELGRKLGVNLPFAELALERFASGLGLEPGNGS
jgi:3-hydroxyisobutyrate dehydrogenase-like beta-hydroxyacid dehydrogenase